MYKLLSKTISSVGYIIKYGCMANCAVEYVGNFVLCCGPSMEPTIHSDDVLLTEHLSPRFNKIERGNIIIAKCPTNPKQNICKRVVGLPGDKIKTGLIKYEVVPVGHVWLEGDNCSNSLDSRSYGPVPLGLVKSKAVFKIWPLRDAKLLLN